MKNVLSTTLFSFIFANLCIADSIELDVINAHPSPNYYLTKDTNDLTQLSDGVITKGVMWTKKSSVGWRKQTPIVLDIRTKRVSESTDKGRFVLSLRVGKSKRSGVYLPRSIDVYSGKNESYQLVGAYRPEKENGGVLEPLKSAEWIKIPLNSVDKNLHVVLHANQHFVMIDEVELEWNAQRKNVELSAASDEDKRSFSSSVREHSSDRLKRELMSASNAQVSNSIHTNKVCMSISQPWGLLTTIDVCKEELENKNPTINSTVANEAVFALSVANNKNANTTLTIENPTNAVKLNVFEILPVVTFNGQRVYDPIVRVLSNESIHIPANGVTHFYVSVVSKSGCSPVSGTLRFLLSGSSTEAQTTTFQFKGCDAVTAKALSGINWYYSFDTPVSNIPKLAVNDLLAHGIDTFVIPPQHLPRLGQLDKFSEQQKDKLSKELLNKKGAKNILFFNSWSSLTENTLEPSEVSRYLEILRQAISSAGLEDVSYFMYPIDEPVKKDLSFLRYVSSLVHERSSDFGMYANPYDKKITYADLLQSVDSIDIWQPSLQFAQTEQWQLFKKKLKLFWVYAVPSRPSKAVSSDWYFRLPERAARLGATGVGFWGYADTRESSAWDDFDGLYGPDASVIYEGDNEIISSRRWEAFRLGMQSAVEVSD